MHDEISDLLDRHKWNESIVKLTAYVVSLCWLKRIILPKGLEAEDIVMEAIEKIYTGERTWDHNNDPDLHRFLMSVVKSILSNKITSKEARTSVLYDDKELSVFQAHDNPEAEMYAKQLDKAIGFKLQGDAQLCLVYKAVKDGYNPKEIAEDYAIDIETVRNAKKRLSRLVYGVINKLTKTRIDEHG
jgi:RNA polymerase sigma factor (sigma-70 family)